jgi:hypothetical protein
LFLTHGHAWGSEDGAKAELGKDVVLAAVHDAVAPVACIVKPTQVQHAVEGVQQQLHAQLYAARFRLSPGLGNAHDDLAGSDIASGIVIEFER